MPGYHQDDSFVLPLAHVPSVDLTYICSCFLVVSTLTCCMMQLEEKLAVDDGIPIYLEINMQMVIVKKTWL